MTAGIDDATAGQSGPESAARLLRAVAAGDRGAFAELFDRFGALFSASVSTVQAEPSARDRLCTEAFSEVWRRAHEGARASQPVLWLLEVLCETLGSARELARRPLGESLLSLDCPDRELLLLAVAGRYSQPEIAALTGVGELRLRVILRESLRTLGGGAHGDLRSA